jgi:uncharacterized protein (DUF2236 family)
VTDPPRSVAELNEQLADFAPALRGDERAWETVDFIRNAPLPLPARAPYAALFAGAVATMPEDHRRLLKLPRIPLTVMRPTISALLGSMAFALGPTSPSMRNAESRVAGMA